MWSAARTKMLQHQLERARMYLYAVIHAFYLQRHDSWIIESIVKDDHPCWRSNIITLVMRLEENLQIKNLMQIQWIVPYVKQHKSIRTVIIRLSESLLVHIAWGLCKHCQLEFQLTSNILHTFSSREICHIIFSPQSSYCAFNKMNCLWSPARVIFTEFNNPLHSKCINILNVDTSSRPTQCQWPCRQPSCKNNTAKYWIYYPEVYIWRACKVTVPAIQGSISA